MRRITAVLTIAVSVGAYGCPADEGPPVITLPDASTDADSDASDDVADVADDTAGKDGDPGTDVTVTECDPTADDAA